MDSIKNLIDIFLHLNTHLKDWSNTMGSTLYVVLFAVLFCETGLVVTPFLPGDSLLFAVGAVAALPGSQVSLPLAIALMFVAAVLGDAVNYSIGLRVGPRAFRSETSFFFNKKHLEKTQGFYARYGGKTIILARFVPIVRTFAPFVAGIGKMQYRRFFAFNVIGAGAWVVICSVAGYLFGNIPWVQKNFEVVLIAIVFISVLPGVIEFVRDRRRGAAAAVVAK